MANRWVLRSRPAGPTISDHLGLEAVDVPAPGDGEFVVEPIFLRAAPPMFKVLVSGSLSGPPAPVGSPVTGAGVGRVTASAHPGYPVGASVTGSMPWQERFLSNGRTVVPVQVFEPTPGISLAAPLHVLGGAGLSAWFGLTEFGRPRIGETLVVSTAAGAVGSVVCQLGKLAGCRVIGITSTAAKGEWLREHAGVDAAIAYRTDDVPARLRELCPDGIDIYFDNVGGDTLDAVLLQLARGARVVLCGASSQYDRAAADWHGPRNYFHLVYQQAQMSGFYIYHFVDRFPEGRRHLTELLAAGKLHYAEDIVDGFANAPAAFDRVLASENLGTQLVRTAAA